MALIVTDDDVLQKKTVSQDVYNMFDKINNHQHVDVLFKIELDAKKNITPLYNKIKNVWLAYN